VQSDRIRGLLKFPKIDKNVYFGYSNPMRAVERKEALLEHILRLRRAEREVPGNHDLVAVRTALEAELGETVSQRLAARFLGTSHSSLQRWIRSGDLPLVFNRAGKQEVPVVELVRLREAVDDERRKGRRRRHILEPKLTAGHARAERLRPEQLLKSEEGRSGHGRSERRSLAYHRALSKQLRRPMVDEALHVIWKWRDQGKLDERYARQWEDVLQQPVSEVRKAISTDSPFARDLRQNSPFAGMLTEAERRKIANEIS